MTKHISTYKKEIGQHPCWPGLIYKLTKFTLAACEEFSTKHEACLDATLPDRDTATFQCLHMDGQVTYWQDIENVSVHAELRENVIIDMELIDKQIVRGQSKAKSWQEWMVLNDKTGVDIGTASRGGMLANKELGKQIGEMLDEDEAQLESTRFDASNSTKQQNYYQTAFLDESNMFDSSHIEAPPAEGIPNQPQTTSSSSTPNPTTNKSQSRDTTQELNENVDKDELIRLLNEAQNRLRRDEEQHHQKVTAMSAKAALEIGAAKEQAENAKRKQNLVQQQLEGIRNEKMEMAAEKKKLENETRWQTQKLLEMEEQLLGADERAAEIKVNFQELSDQHQKQTHDIKEKQRFLQEQQKKTRSSHHAPNLSQISEDASELEKRNSGSKNLNRTNQHEDEEQWMNNEIGNTNGNHETDQSRGRNKKLTINFQNKSLNEKFGEMHTGQGNTSQNNSNGNFRNNFADNSSDQRNSWKHNVDGQNFAKTVHNYAADYTGNKTTLNASIALMNKSWNPQGNLKGLNFEVETNLLDGRAVRQCCKFAQFEQNKLLRSWNKDHSWGKLKEDARSKVAKFDSQSSTMWQWLKSEVQPYLQVKSLENFSKAALLPYLFEPSEIKKLESSVDYILTPFLEAEREWTHIHMILLDNKKLTMADVWNSDDNRTFEDRVAELDKIRFSESLLLGESFFALCRIICPEEDIKHSPSLWRATGREPITTLLEESIFRVLIAENSGTNKSLTSRINQSNLKKAFELMLQHLKGLPSVEAKVILKRMLQSNEFPFLYSESLDFVSQPYTVASVGKELNMIWVQTKKQCKLGFGHDTNYALATNVTTKAENRNEGRFEKKDRRVEFDEKKSFKNDKRKPWQQLHMTLQDIKSGEKCTEFSHFIEAATGDAELGGDLLNGICFTLIDNAQYDGESTVEKSLELAAQHGIFANMEQFFKLLSVETTLNNSKTPLELLADTCSSINMIRSDALYALNLYDRVERNADMVSVETAGGPVVLQDVVNLQVNIGALDCGVQKFFVVGRKHLKSVRGILGIPTLQICGLLPHIKTWFKNAQKGAKQLSKVEIKNENNFKLNFSKQTRELLSQKATRKAEQARKSIISNKFKTAAAISLAIIITTIKIAQIPEQKAAKIIDPDDRTTENRKHSRNLTQNSPHTNIIYETGPEITKAVMFVITFITIATWFILEKIAVNKNDKRETEARTYLTEKGKPADMFQREILREQTQSKSQIEEREAEKSVLGETKTEPEKIDLTQKFDDEDINKFDEWRREEGDSEEEEAEEFEIIVKTIEFTTTKPLENKESPFQVNYFHFTPKMLPKKITNKFEKALKKNDLQFVDNTKHARKKKRVWDENVGRLSKKLGNNARNDVFEKLSTEAAECAETFFHAGDISAEERERTDIECLYAQISPENLVNFTKFNCMIANGEIRKSVDWSFEDIKSKLKQYRWKEDDKPTVEVVDVKAPALVKLKTKNTCVIESFGFKLVDIYFPAGTEAGLKFVTTEPILNKTAPVPFEVPSRAITTADGTKNSILVLNNGPVDITIQKNTEIVNAKLLKTLCTSRFDDENFLKPRQNIDDFKLAELLGQLEIIYRNPFFQNIDMSRLETSAQERYKELSNQVKGLKKEKPKEEEEESEKDKYVSKMKLSEVNFEELLNIDEKKPEEECHLLEKEGEDEIMTENLVKIAKSNEEVIKKNQPEKLGDKLLSQNNIAQIKSLPKNDRVKLLEKLREFSQERITEFLEKVEEIKKDLKKKGWPHEEFISVLIENCDRFSGDEVSAWKLINVPENLLQIPLQENIPQKIIPNYIKKPSLEEMETLNDFVAQNLCRGLIRQSTSNYINPILLVKKPNNRGFRVCLDFRKMNETVFDSASHSVPLIIDMILAMGNSELFSAFDISSAYYRVRLPNKIRKFTGFSIPKGPFTGQYEFTVLPFGIKSAVSIFSQIMDHCLKGLQYKSLLWYLDDCLLHTICEIIGLHGRERELSNLKEHCKAFEIFLKRSRKFNINYSIEKATFLRESTEFLGFMIGQGILIPATKIINKIADVQAMCKIEKPKRNWLRILGFFNYLSKYIPRFAHQRKIICKYIDKWNEYAALTRSIKKRNIMRAIIQFEVDKIICFWSMCIRTTRLVIPKAGEPLTLFTDASGFNIGFVLLSADGKIVEFGSRVLSETECRYFIEEKEILSVAEAILKTRCYGARASIVNVKLDNKNNVRSIISHQTPPSSTRSERLLNKLKLYGEISVTYVSSEKNISDFLTRDCVDLDTSNLEALKEVDARILEENEIANANENNSEKATETKKPVKPETEVKPEKQQEKPQETTTESSFIVQLQNKQKQAEQYTIKLHDNDGRNENNYFETPEEIRYLEKNDVDEEMRKAQENDQQAELSNYEKMYFNNNDRGSLKTDAEISAIVYENEIEDWEKIEKIMECLPREEEKLSDNFLPSTKQSNEKHKKFYNLLSKLAVNESEIEEDEKNQELSQFTMITDPMIRTWTGNEYFSREEFDEVITKPSEITEERKIVLIKNFHVNLHHMKAEKLLKQLLIMLPNISFSIRKIKEIVEKCHTCAIDRKLGATSACGRIPIPSRPYESVAIDHFQYGNYTHGKFKYILSVKCLFSKHVCLCLVRTKTMLEVWVSLDQIFSLTGKPASIRLDNAFKTSELITWSYKRDIILIFTPAYRPQANGAVERIHRDIKNLVPKICKAWKIEQSEWFKVVPEVAKVMNQSVHSSTGYPPELIWRGFLQDEFYLYTQNDRLSLLNLWDKVKQNLKIKQEKRVNVPKFNSKLELKEDTRVYMKLPNKPLEIVTVKFDHGSTAYLERESFPAGHRYRFLTLHKDLLREYVETETEENADAEVCMKQVLSYFTK